MGGKPWAIASAFRADGRFELLGRADRIAKIEDKRVSLSEIERRLLEHAYVKDVVAVALEDDGAAIRRSRRGADGRGARSARGAGEIRRELGVALVVARPNRCRRVAARVPLPGGNARRCAGQTPDRRARRIVRPQVMTTEPIVVEQRVAPPEAELA